MQIWPNAWAIVPLRKLGCMVVHAHLELLELESVLERNWMR